MSEIDLIPSEYRNQRFLIRWAKSFLSIQLVLVIMIIVGVVYIHQLKAKSETTVNTLQARKEISTRQGKELELLNTQKAALQQQLRLLTGLRSGAAAEEMFLTIDRAINDDKLWFLHWKFQRAGTVVNPDEQTIDTGYFIVIPSGEQPAITETWQIETHMTIDGQALDHSALSVFVSRLINQPQINDVRVLRTELINHRDTRVVDFSLAVTVTGGVESK